MIFWGRVFFPFMASLDCVPCQVDPCSAMEVEARTGGHGATIRGPRSTASASGVGQARAGERLNPPHLSDRR